jgi:branched-chain amino acid transport system substrate-binding protein
MLTLWFSGTSDTGIGAVGDHIQAYYPEHKIGVLWQNDEFGRDLYRGLEEGLGASADMIVSDIAVDGSDKSINSHLSVLKDLGAKIVILDIAPALAARAIRQMAEIDWHPVVLLNNASASIASALRPAGLENSIGVISTSFLKDAGDPAWQDDNSMKEFSSFMDKYYPEGDKEDSNSIFGYAAAEALAQVLKQCGDDLSRENVVRQSQSLKNFQSSVLRPGITMNTSPDDFRLIKQMRLVQFDGRTWWPIGDVIDSAFLDAAGDARQARPSDRLNQRE